VGNESTTIEAADWEGIVRPSEVMGCDHQRGTKERSHGEVGLASRGDEKGGLGGG